MGLCFGVASWVDFESPLLSEDPEALAVLDVLVDIPLVVEFIGLVDVLGVDLVPASGNPYRALRDFRLKWKKVPSLYSPIISSSRVSELSSNCSRI